MQSSDPYDFDRLWPSEGTDSIKWEFVSTPNGPQPWDRARASQGDARVLPMWVADMDFAVAPEISEAMKARAAHPVYGYAGVGDDYRAVVANWQHERNGWLVDPEWVVPIPGIVPAMNLIVRRFTNPGDGVIVQRPVYHPFSFAVNNNGRDLRSASLKFEDGCYRMDLEALEREASDPNVKLALLCSPHNPVGRVWSARELADFSHICARNNVLVFADEIHCDLTLPGYEFVPYGTVDAVQGTAHIVGTAASKAFNLAGLKSANLIISEPALRTQMQAEIRATGLMGMNPFGIVATRAAYQHGGPWLDAALDYIAANVTYLRTFLRERLPRIQLIEPQGTYLAWMDMRALGLSQGELGELLMERARLYLDEGHIFGPEGVGFARINVACPRSILELALARLQAAVETLPASSSPAA
jgi:cysteine-S-conjugate beta-lyase